jgi:hypothetical protein
MHINRTLSIALIALVIILLSAPAQSDIIKKGQVGFRFLDNPISAEAVGRGGMGGRCCATPMPRSGIRPE